MPRIFITDSTMDPNDDLILDAAMAVVTRYGMRRTTMGDIARESDVSRQTLYDRYGGKDGIMAASIALLARRLCADLQVAFAAASDLGAKMDAYFDIAIYPIFEMFQAMPDAADLEKGLGPASVAASEDAEKKKQALLEDMLRHHLPPGGATPADVALFVEQASARAKASITSRAELATFLSVLKASVLAMTRTG